MADVNANLPMWSKAFWSQKERDKRREAAESKEFERRLVEAVILQEMVNKGRITEQQAKDAAAASRQKEALAQDERLTRWTAGAQMERDQIRAEGDLAVQRQRDENRAKLERELVKEQLTARYGPNYQDNWEERFGVEQQEGNVRGLNAITGAAEAFGRDQMKWTPEARELVGRIVGRKTGQPFQEAPKSGRIRLGTTAPPKTLPKDGTTEPPPPAPTGPQPRGAEQTLAPSRPAGDTKLLEDWIMLQQSRKVLPTPKR